MTARLVLICHASTDAVRKSIFPDDEPLDAHGLKDAAALAGHLPHVERCWTSPELRTRQTAEAMQLNADVNRCCANATTDTGGVAASTR